MTAFEAAQTLLQSNIIANFVILPFTSSSSSIRQRGNTENLDQLIGAGHPNELFIGVILFAFSAPFKMESRPENQNLSLQRKKREKKHTNWKQVYSRFLYIL